MKCLVDACDELGEYYYHWYEVDKQAAVAVEMQRIETAFLEIEQVVIN